MRVSTTTSFELLSGDLRMDASFHASPGQYASRVLKNSKLHTDYLGEVCQSGGIFIPGRFRRVYVDKPENGLRWLSPSDMQKADLSGLGYISRKYTSNLDTLRLHKGWILLSRSGTIGNLAFVRSDMDGLIGSDDIIRIVANQEKILSGYLFAVLSSPLLVSLIQQKTYGAVIPHIETQHIIDLLIPRLDPVKEERINHLIKQAAELRVEANRVKLHAQRKLTQLLGVQLEPAVPVSNFIQINIGDLNDRFEATYHRAKQSVTAFDKSPFPLVPIKSLLERIFYLGKLHRVFVEDSNSGFPLLSISDVQKAKLTSNKYVSKSLSRNVGDALLKRGWVLISRVGTPGLVVYTRREMEGFAGTDHLVRLVPNHNKVLPGFLFSILSSPIGQNILMGSAHGSVQLVLPPEYIERIKIPVPPIESQQEINDLIDQYGESLTLASEMEDQAQAILAQSLIVSSLNT